MEMIINKSIEAYKYVFTELSDPRTNNWLLMSSPGPLIAIVASYLYFCTSFGPRFMRDRKPYELKHIVMLYNIFQIVFSTFLFNMGLTYILSKEFSFKCTPVNYSNSPMILYVVSAFWWFFFAKLTELIDTMFFVLRKKDNQISFLHVYHHTMMCIATWAVVKYIPGGGSPAIMGTINAFVHIVMYTYYFISGLGPEYQKYVWWKKHVTLLQLIQFVIVLFYSVNELVHECSYPKIINVFLSLNSILFLYLFGKFYVASYNKIGKNGQKNGALNSGASIKRE